MDGRLAFFEQDSVSFTCLIPGILLPAPFAYISRSDSFVFVNSQMTCEVYSYQMLGSAPATGSQHALQRNWGVHLGQHVVDVVVAHFTEQSGPLQPDIVIIGERSLMALKPQGLITMQRLLDINPSCVTSYATGPTNEVGARRHLIVGTHQKSLLIFRDSQLIWAAKTKAVPIAVSVATIAGLPGMIVVLLQNGELQVCYLGTDPRSIAKDTLNLKEVDYGAIATEYRDLQKTIRQMQNNAVSNEPGDKVILSVDGDVRLDADSSVPFVLQKSNQVAYHANGTPVAIAIDLRVEYRQEDPIECLYLEIDTGAGFIAETNSICLRDFATRGEKSAKIPIRIFASRTTMPVDSSVKVAVSFINVNGQPRITIITIPLPFEAFYTIVPPTRNTQFFLTIETNRPAPSSLKALFPTMESSSNPSVLSVKYHCKNGLDSTIILSKNAGRYRIQSSEFLGLPLLTNDLIARLHLYWNLHGEIQAEAMAANGPLRISLDSQLPLDEFWTIVDSHLNTRNSIHSNTIAMEKLSRQLRAIQKRLLPRFKDATPSSLANLDVLLRETLANLIKCGDGTRLLQEEMERSGNDLSSVLSLLGKLLAEICQLDEQNCAHLSAYFSPIADDGIEQGWEERFDAAIAFLLSTSLSKEERAQSVQLVSELTIPGDTKRLRKHVKIVIDRLLKGMPLYKSERKKGK